jgi:hypothetical protein
MLLLIRQRNSARGSRGRSLALSRRSACPVPVLVTIPLGRTARRDVQVGGWRFAQRRRRGGRCSGSADAATALLLVPGGKEGGDELDASSLEIAEEPVLAGWLRFSGRQPSRRLLFAPPKEKLRIPVAAAASPQRRRAAAPREGGRRARAPVVVESSRQSRNSTMRNDRLGAGDERGMVPTRRSVVVCRRFGADPPRADATSR